MSFTFCSFSGCGAISGHIQGDDVCKKLEKKYGEKFGWSSIGDRWFTNHAEVTAYPVSNEDLKFTAILNFNTNEIRDDYEDQKQIYVMRRDIVQQYKNSGVECRCAIDKENQPENAYFIKLYFSEQNMPSAKLFKRISDDTYNKYHCTKYGVVGNIYNNNQYKKVCECLDKQPDGNGFDLTTNDTIYNFRYDISTNGSVTLRKCEAKLETTRVPISFEDLQKDLVRISNGNVK